MRTKFWILPISVATLGLAAAALFYSSSSTAAPGVTWAPSSVTQTVVAGQTKTTVASFTASENLSNLVVWVVPELQSLVHTTPDKFASVTKGQTVTLTVTTTVPITASSATLDGTIHLSVGSRTIAKPLPVVVTTVGVLPPDPGEAGKVTVAGIDANRNGVRDDVERWIAIRFTATGEKSALMQAAKALQIALTSGGDPSLSNSAALESVRASQCMGNRFPTVMAAIDANSELLGQMINTDARFLSERAWMRNTKGLTWGTFPNGGCDF